MFPTIKYEDENENLPEASMGKVFLFDYDKREFVLKDGKPVLATYEQAIKQWITMVLITERGKYQVYKDLDLGLNIAQFIGRKDIPLGVINSEVKRQIEEQLIRHPEIVGISDFALTRQDSKAIFSFSVHTKQGTLIEGVQSEVKYSG
nr:DUF2634 domain-containing protein [Cohnella sp. WQ 127256]